MSKDKLAKDLADEIFDMIDRNYPRGLIKSDLADLIGKHMTAWQTKHDLINPDVFPPKPYVAPVDLTSPVDISPGSINGRTWTSNKPEKDVDWEFLARKRGDELSKYLNVCGNVCGND